MPVFRHKRVWVAWICTAGTLEENQVWIGHGERVGRAGRALLKDALLGTSTDRFNCAASREHFESNASI